MDHRTIFSFASSPIQTSTDIAFYKQLVSFSLSVSLNPWTIIKIILLLVQIDIYVNLMIQRIANSILPNSVLVYYCLQILWLYSDQGTTEVRQACLVMVIKPINLNSEFTGMEFTKFILCSDPLPHVQCQPCRLLAILGAANKCSNY